MSEVKVNKISPRSGTDVTVGGKLITESNGDLNLYPNGTGAVEVGGNTNPGTIILNCENNSHGIKLQSPPHSANQSYTLKFPSGNVTAGKFLKVDSVSGSGTTGVGTMTFADVSSPGLTFLATATGSDASAISLDGYFSSSYDHYVIFYSVYAQTDNTDTIVRVRQSDADVTSSNYRYAGQGQYVTSSASSANDAGGWDAAYWRISSSDNTNNILYQTTGQMTLSNPLSTSTYKTFTTTSIGYNSGSPPTAIRVWNYAGYFKANTSALSGISFLYDGGNINGTIKLFGVRNS